MPRLHALYPNLTDVGEVYSPDPTVVSYFAGGEKHAGIDTGRRTPCLISPATLLCARR